MHETASSIPRQIFWWFLALLPIFPLVVLLLVSDDKQSVVLDAGIIAPYVWTTLRMVLMTSFLALAFGVILAWVFEFFSFPLKKLLSWLVLTPFILPPYIIAMVYVEHFAPSGFWGGIIYQWFGFFNPRQEVFASFILSISFYPYVYLLCRSFLLSSNSFVSNVEMARVMGLSLGRCFWRLFLPMMMPQLIAGFVLVGLEVMADYGAMSFFSVKTLSMGLYDLWLNLGEVAYARYFAMIILLVVIGFLLLNRLGQKIRIFSEGHFVAGKVVRGHARLVALSSSQKILWYGFVFLLLTIGFFFPLLSLLWWFFEPLWRGVGFYDWVALWNHHWGAVATSFTLAFMAGLLLVFFTLLLSFYQRQSQQRLIVLPMTLGYALPGVLIAIGIFIMAHRFFPVGGFASSAWFLVPLLFYGYLIKFSASSMGAVASGYRSISINLDNAARALGEQPIGFFGESPNHFLAGLFTPLQEGEDEPAPKQKTLSGILGFIHLPLLRPALLSGFLLVFIEVVRELPITLVLRPFGLETLSIQIFTYVSDERIKIASFPALLIVMVGVLSMWLVKKYWLVERR